MSTQTEIRAALVDAFNAYDRLPALEGTILDLQETIELLRMELEERKAKITELEHALASQSMTIDNLTSDLGKAREVIATDENRIMDLTNSNNTHYARIRDLEVDVTARSTMIDLLEADKAALITRLERFEGLEWKLRAALQDVTSATLEVVAPTFQSPVDSGEGNNQVVSVEPKPVVETVRVAEEVKQEHYTPFFGG